MVAKSAPVAVVTPALGAIPAIYVPRGRSPRSAGRIGRLWRQVTARLKPVHTLPRG